jgi:hypothetical protein
MPCNKLHCQKVVNRNSASIKLGPFAAAGDAARRGLPEGEGLYQKRGDATVLTALHAFSGTNQAWKVTALKPIRTFHLGR